MANRVHICTKAGFVLFLKRRLAGEGLELRYGASPNLRINWVLDAHGKLREFRVLRENRVLTWLRFLYDFSTYLVAITPAREVNKAELRGLLGKCPSMHASQVGKLRQALKDYLEDSVIDEALMKRVIEKSSAASDREVIAEWGCRLH